MADYHTVRRLYERYLEQAVQLERSSKVTDKLFGFGAGPGDHPCHKQFADDLEQLLKEYAAQKPDSGQSARMLEYIYQAPLEHQEVKSAYWMLLAVHGLTLELIDTLSAGDAGSLRAAYRKWYRPWELLPAQKRVLKALDRIR